jgi:hypothetical protein
MTAMGHEDQFLPPGSRARSRISQGTFLRTQGNGRDAPKPDIPLTEKFGASDTLTGLWYNTK